MDLSKIRFEHKTFASLEDIPREFIRLREVAYVEELQDWQDGEMINQEDLNSEHIFIYLEDMRWP